MHPLLDEKLTDYRERDISRVKLGLTDLDGVLRGKYVSLDKLATVMRSGGGFCDCVFGWDVDDQLYDNASFTGWHTGFPDARFRLVTGTERLLPDEGVPFFLGEFVAADGDDHAICPRSRLRCLLERAEAMGLTFRMGFEYEFFVFRETPGSLRQKGFRDLTPLTPGNFGYSVLRTAALADVFNAFQDYLDALGSPLEGLHCETGPGVWEGALAPAAALEAADRATLFKTFSKAFFQRRDLTATFMAKWSMDYPGQSGHLHFSIFDGERNAFHEPGASAHMSARQRHAVAGVIHYLPELTALFAPTVNSYTRLVKGAWAPTAATWGIENRTAAVRVIPGSEQSQRIECRVPGADANPYLAAAAVVAAALAGIEDRLEPDAPVAGNAYEVEDALPASRRLPPDLGAAATLLEGSRLARSLLGEAFVDHFVASRRWECREYQRHVNDWQLNRYFEII